MPAKVTAAADLPYHFPAEDIGRCLPPEASSGRVVRLIRIELRHRSFLPIEDCSGRRLPALPGDEPRLRHLNETMFHNQAHARVVISAWVADYNTERPNSASDYQTPADYARDLTTAIARPASASGDCSTCANRRKNQSGSSRSWMKVQWQVNCSRMTTARCLEAAEPYTCPLRRFKATPLKIQ